MRICVIIFMLLFNSLMIAQTEIAAYPQFSYSDETGFMGGFISFLRFQFDEYPAEIPKQNVTSQILYSFKKQFNFSLMPAYFSRNGIYQIEADLDYRYWPSEFFGVGNTDYDKEGEKFTPQKISSYLQVKRKIARNWYILALSEFYHNELLKTEEGGDLENNSIPGSEDFSLVGFGSGIQFDRRNSTTYPTSGEIIKFSFLGYNSAFSSDYNFMQFNFLASKFFSLTEKQVIALSSKFIYTDTAAPFQKLPHLGEEVRAYPDEIFIDEKMYSLRSEYRIFPWSGKFVEKLGFVFFFDTGQTAAQIDDFSRENIHCSYGVGFRYSVFVEDRFNVRLDVGFCKENSSFEISGGEAF